MHSDSFPRRADFDSYEEENDARRRLAQQMHLRQLALRRHLIESVTPEDLGDIANALLQRARTGQIGAVKLLLQYCDTFGITRGDRA